MVGADGSGGMATEACVTVAFCFAEALVLPEPCGGGSGVPFFLGGIGVTAARVQHEAGRSKQLSRGATVCDTYGTSGHVTDYGPGSCLCQLSKWMRGQCDAELVLTTVCSMKVTNLDTPGMQVYMRL